MTKTNSSEGLRWFLIRGPRSKMVLVSYRKRYEYNRDGDKCNKDAGRKARQVELTTGSTRSSFKA